MYTLRPYQSKAKQAILTEWDKGQRKTLLVLPTGCHAVGERLLMADGTSRSVENIAVGDKLLGADGKPRLVLRRHTGYDLLFRITPDHGEPFIVTGDHKLTLVRNDKLIDVTVMEWLSWDENKRSKYMLIRSGCISEFPDLRGHAVPLNELVPKLVRRVKDQHLTAIVIDPIYKVIMGDENNASDMGAFCNQFDKICMETGCSVIYCHHHSKGAQGAKKAMDRASGSGVFARDPDAQLDMIELELSDDIKNFVRDGYATGWRLESSLREFPNIKPAI